MTINMLDCSNYQQYDFGNIQPQYLHPIDWVALSKDARQFRAVYCKAAEGIGVANYPIADYQRQVNGALAAGLAAGPYHFWYGSLNARDQAKTFYDATYGCAGTLPPMVDLENTEILKTIAWQGGERTLSAAIANAKYLLDATLWLYLQEVERLFGKVPLIYSGAWWWNQFVNLLLLPQSSTNPAPWPENKAVVDKYVKYSCYGAAYATTYQPCTGLKNILWQYTSTPVPAVAGVGVKDKFGVPGGAVDCGRWLLSDDEFYKWSGLKPPVVVPPVDLTALTARVASLETEAADLQAKLDHVNARLTGLDNYLTSYKP